MGEEVVGSRTPLDDPHHFVRQRIDDVLDIAGVVALEDPDHHPVIGVEPRHVLGSEGRSEERNPQEHQQESSRRLNAHRRPPQVRVSVHVRK